MAQTVVITGGGGFVGRYLMAELRQHWADADIISWDKSSFTAPPGVKRQQIDIRQPASYSQALADLKPDWVVHLAAVSAIAVGLAQPRLVHEVNVTATINLLQALAEITSSTKILAVSSADIYGQQDQSAYPLEELPLEQCRPNNPYAQSKWDMEKAIEQNFLESCIRVRPFPHIGPGQARGFVTADFASQIAAIEAGQQPNRIEVGNLEAKRDFTDVRDVVRAYRLLLEKGELGQVYNIASGRAVSIKSVLGDLLALSTQAIKVHTDPERLRPSDTPLVIGSAAKLQAATNWQPSIPLKETLQDILADWRERVKSRN